MNVLVNVSEHDSLDVFVSGTFTFTSMFMCEQRGASPTRIDAAAAKCSQSAQALQFDTQRALRE
jgi:hypothetical protein